MLQLKRYRSSIYRRDFYQSVVLVYLITATDGLELNEMCYPVRKELKRVSGSSKFNLVNCKK